jgi:hypothetical protein
MSVLSFNNVGGYITPTLIENTFYGITANVMDKSYL